MVNQRMRGVAWRCVALRGVAWRCVALRGVAWRCVALRGVAWRCVRTDTLVVSVGTWHVQRSVLVEVGLQVAAQEV